MGRPEHVLVTGGAGFVGSHTVDELVDQGMTVTVLDNFDEQVHTSEPDYLNTEAEYVRGDVRSRSTIKPLLQETDAVIHLASAVGVGQSMYEIEEYVEVNSLGTATILDIVVKEDIELKKFVVASSMSIYGEGEYRCDNCGGRRFPSLRDKADLEQGWWEPRCSDCGKELFPVATSEDAQADVTSVYASTKRSQEELVRTVCRSYDIPTVSLRYFNIYGSRQSLNNPYTGVCAIFSSRIKNENPPLVYEDGGQSRDFVHVTDVARATVASVLGEVSDEVINVGTGTSTTIYHIAEELIELYGADLDPKITADFREGDIRHCFADNTKATELLDWEPKVSLQQGLHELRDWATSQESTDKFSQSYTELSEHDLVKSIETNER